MIAVSINIYSALKFVSFLDMLLGWFIEFPHLHYQELSNLLLIPLWIAFCCRQFFLICQLSKYFKGKVFAIGKISLNDIVNFIEPFKRSHQSLFHNLIFLIARWLNLEIILEDEGCLVMVSNNLCRSIVLLTKISRVRSANFFLQPGQVFEPKCDRSGVLC